ncbi:DUF4097 family beta strand repeat-containing protein [Halorussus sp. MSC15.2]|uniref:DUF4097 family beta strand repeat-containing protein n=1 Tax=Halorussus sp. MSC15.2 TaxID=2283638 RepID=UPI0013D44E50|nr:DUF4097 family beta strand repeat-containing protein [Halorussus sp. MSC15.2]NEU55987.1 DUF4097 domain-containing protein [Halorussus sp. MSC15.2]
MKVDTRRRRLLGLSATGALATLSGCSGATPFVGKRLEDARTFDVDSVDSVTVLGQNGDVRVRTTDADRVRVGTVKKSGSVFADLDDVRVEMGVENGELTVEPHQTGNGSWLGGMPSVEISVELPSGVGLGKLRSENGSVDVRGVESDATLVTENGRIDAHDIDGFVTAESENGNVTIRDVSGVGDVRTENGSIDVEFPAIRGQTTVESENGNVTAAVAPDMNATLIATTDNGDLTVELPNFEAEIRNEHLVQGTLGDGGPELRFVTENGSVGVSALR